MDRIGASLRRLGQPQSDIFLIDWPDAPPKGDAFDFVERGGTKETLNGLLRTAQRWRSGQDRESSGAGPPATRASQTTTTPGSSGLNLGKDPSQATLLVALARTGDAELFHDPMGQTFISFDRNGHRETWPLTSRNTREWLSRQFYEAYKTSPGGDALKNALTTVGGIATFDGACREVFVRLGGHEGDIYIDLGNPAWEVVRIRASGWDVIPGSEAPVRFRRPRGLLPLPHPVPGGELTALRTLINVADDDGFDLVVGWLVGALNPRGTYAILVFTGEQGSAKTTAGRVTRGCLDPNVVPLRSQPREEADMLIAASNGLVVAYDNLSKLPDWLSDALCRLTSGGGVGKRQFFTDGDEFILDARRPALLTGIESVLSRGDAIDRALLVELRTMTKGQRRTDEDVWSAFEDARPGLLGLLCDAASTALHNLSSIKIDELPRLADFARWVEAAAPALGWEPGHFLAIYNSNRDNADEIAVEASSIGPTLRVFLDGLGGDGTWEGTASELLAALNERVSEATKKEQEWPKRANSLSGHVKRLAPHLRRLGFGVRIGDREGHEGRRLIRLAKGGANQRQHRQQDGDHAENPHTHADSGAESADDPTPRGSSATVSRSSADRQQQARSASEKPRDDVDSSDVGRCADGADDALPVAWENAPADCPYPWECDVRGPCPGYGEGCPLAATARDDQPREVVRQTPLTGAGGMTPTIAVTAHPRTGPKNGRSNRLAAPMQPRMITTSMGADFFTVSTLETQTGFPKEWFPDVILKELIDNALDGCETAGVAPGIVITVDRRDDLLAISVTDNGLGLDPDTVARIADFATRTSDKAVYRKPSRGAQGNALKTVLGIVTALGGDQPVVIESRGVRHAFSARLRPGGSVDITHETSPCARHEGTMIHADCATTAWLRWPGLGQALRLVQPACHLYRPEWQESDEDDDDDGSVRMLNHGWQEATDFLPRHR